MIPAVIRATIAIRSMYRDPYLGKHPGPDRS
jgi:hypothetical protein